MEGNYGEISMGKRMEMDGWDNTKRNEMEWHSEFGGKAVRVRVWWATCESWRTRIESTVWNFEFLPPTLQQTGRWVRGPTRVLIQNGYGRNPSIWIRSWVVVDGTLYVDIRWNEIRWDEIRWDWYGDWIVQLLCTTITNKTFSASLSLEIRADSHLCESGLFRTARSRIWGWRE